MAGRNRKDAADYFSHDSDASSDEKIVYLESLFGHTGYAVYFKFLERMVRAKDFEIEWNNIKKAIYSIEFRISVTEIDRIVSECCRNEIKAFEIVGGKMFSPGLKKRMQPLLEKREYNRLKYEEQKKRKPNDNKGFPISVTESGISVTKTTQRKGKERKGKERKTFVPDSQEIRLSELLFSLMRDNNPNAKTPNFQNWGHDIDLAIRIDKRTPAEIERIIRWAQSDPFWHTNVLSTAKLRKQFDTLVLKANAKTTVAKTIKNQPKKLYNENPYAD